MRVKVTRLGFIGKRRVRPGDVIEVEEKQFSKNWMVKLAKGEAPKAPEETAAPEPKPGPKGKGKKGGKKVI